MSLCNGTNSADLKCGVAKASDGRCFATLIDNARQETESGTELGAALVWLHLLEFLLRRLLAARQKSRILKRTESVGYRSARVSSLLQEIKRLGLLNAPTCQALESLFAVKQELAHAGIARLESSYIRNRCKTASKAAHESSSALTPLRQLAVASMHCAACIIATIAVLETGCAASDLAENKIPQCSCLNNLIVKATEDSHVASQEGRTRALSSPELF